MSDRTDQARAEAERTYGHAPLGPMRSGLEAGFSHGMQWADANPRPCTITEKRLREFTIFVLDQADDARGVRWAVVHLLGIEVEDNDE